MILTYHNINSHNRSYIDIINETHNNYNGLMPSQLEVSPPWSHQLYVLSAKSNEEMNE